ncbi:MAG: hypothetical protein HPY44_11125 [Armatimonadetes bacterium]|nr:hypothetical protein [Armatimonadota bacterium]
MLIALPALSALLFAQGAVAQPIIQNPSFEKLDETGMPDGSRVYRFDGDQPVWVVWNALRDSEVTVDVGDASVFPCDL